MATTISKQKTFTNLLNSVGKNGKHKPVAERPVLEQFIYAILRENATREAADQSFQQLLERFYDWNEVRVSSALELVEAFDGVVPDAEARAQRIIDFLQEIFETTYSFDLEPLLEVLQKKGLKQASKQLSRYQAASAFTVAWVIQHSLNSHAVPLDASGQRVLVRLGLIDDALDPETLRATLENQVPKAKGMQFVDLLSDLADSHCHEDSPDCPHCSMRSTCPTAQEAKLLAASSKKPR